MNGKRVAGLFSSAAHPTNQSLLDVVSVWLVCLRQLSNFSLEVLSEILYNYYILVRQGDSGQRQADTS